MSENKEFIISGFQALSGNNLSAEERKVIINNLEKLLEEDSESFNACKSGLASTYFDLCKQKTGGIMSDKESSDYKCMNGENFAKSLIYYYKNKNTEDSCKCGGFCSKYYCKNNSKNKYTIGCRK